MPGSFQFDWPLVNAQGKRQVQERSHQEVVYALKIWKARGDGLPVERMLKICSIVAIQAESVLHQEQHVEADADGRRPVDLCNPVVGT
jgi:hypothetical protein